MAEDSSSEIQIPEVMQTVNQEEFVDQLVARLSEDIRTLIDKSATDPLLDDFDHYHLSKARKVFAIFRRDNFLHRIYSKDTYQ